MTKKVVRYKRINGALVKQFEVPPLIGGLVDIASLPIVGTMGSAVIESGSNANGSYIKFADGTMVCYCSPAVMRGAALSQGSEIVVTYPAAYISPPRIALTLLDSVNASGTPAGGKVAIPLWNQNGHWLTQSSSHCAISQYGYNVDASNAYVSLNVIAIGRWK